MGDCHSSDPGSNPGPGAYTSLRIPTLINSDCHINNKNNKEGNINSEADTRLVAKTNNNSDNYKPIKLFNNNQMRDLYNRKKKLDYWVEIIHKDLDEQDKKAVLKFLEIMQEKDQNILTITCCISIVIQIRKQIDKSLSKVTKEDIKIIFQ